MSRFANEYKLECFKRIRFLNDKGNLWLAEDSVTGDYAVIRKLSPDCREVYERLAAIRHPNLPEISDVFVHGGFLYVVEEYLDWELLSEKIKTGGLPQKQAFLMGRQILKALAALHRHGIVHRDVKPENIMVNEAGAVKLMDFHIGRIFSEGKEKDTREQGTKGYAAPEQFGFAQSDCRADLYAFGVTLNELAAGEPPEVKKCAGRLGIVAGKCMQFDPARRYQSAAQALKHMEWLFQKLPRLLAAGCLALGLIAGACCFSAHRGEGSLLKTPSSLEELSAGTAYQDRIIAARDPDRYPAVLMTGDEAFRFTVDAEGKTRAAAEKHGERLTLTCVSANREKRDFSFEDVFSDTYGGLGYSINTEFEKTSPEYELLMDDFNEDGTEDLLITLAWRRRMGRPDGENRYYLTEYSTLWLVYRDGEGKWNCAEPLYFEGCAPALQKDALLYDPGTPTWYSFREGRWHEFY